MGSAPCGASAQTGKLVLQEKREAARLVHIQANAVLMQVEVERLRARVMDRREAQVAEVVDGLLRRVRGAASDDGSGGARSSTRSVTG